MVKGEKKTVQVQEKKGKKRKRDEEEGTEKEEKDATAMSKYFSSDVKPGNISDPKYLALLDESRTSYTYPTRSGWLISDALSHLCEVDKRFVTLVIKYGLPGEYPGGDFKVNEKTVREKRDPVRTF